jgi:hypothetical protein
MKKNDEYLKLIGLYLDGTADEVQTRTLESALRSDRELRREFLSYIHLDAALQSGQSAPRTAPVPPARTPSAALRVWLGCAAALVLSLGGAMWHYTKSRMPSKESPVPFAVLAAARETVWADPNIELALRAGEMPSQRIELESGAAEFVCADGARVILHGPAALRFVERRRIFLDHGRALFRCPNEESRLTVETPGTEIVDLGTEFWVESLPKVTTRVHVLSGEVQVGRNTRHRLHAGDSAEIRSDGLLVIPPLSTNAFAELLPSSPQSDWREPATETNLLRDPGFEAGLMGGPWSGTEGHTEPTPQGRSGRGIRIGAGRNAHWPLCRQTLETGDIGGRMVTASAWAAVSPGDPLCSRQHALLKIAFKNAEGRDFAFAVQRFVGPGSLPGRFLSAQIAAIAPHGTQRVQFQLLLHSDLQDSGSVIFDDASLSISDPPLKNP